MHTMISLENIEYLCHIPVKHLEAIAHDSGYLDAQYISAKFAGLNGYSQFCYDVVYIEDGQEHKVRAYVVYHPDIDKTFLDY